MNRKRRIVFVPVLASFLLAVPGVLEGQLAPPAGPSEPGSARFTLNDIWSRLSTGASGALRAGAFLEPAAGPSTVSTKTTNEVMAAAPAADNVNGATAADVAAGKIFWGLRTTGGTWGLTTGTATGGGSAFPAPVVKTGQTQCYKVVAGTWVLDEGCTTNTPAGQDGKLQKGVAWPNPRFTKNTNGTVTDNLTGLIWLQNALCPVFFPGDTSVNGNYRYWLQAMTAANSLASGSCGLTDGSTAGQWRLPNVRELQSLLDYAHFNPALSNAAGTGHWTEGDPFTNVSEGFKYWTSTTKVGANNNYIWTVYTINGQVSDLHRTLDQSYVWPVRGGQ